MKRMLMMSALISLWCTPGQAANDVKQMGTILVEDTRIEEPSKARLILNERVKGPVSDGGDLLKTVPGIAGGRIGGHGMEPVIRGQSQTRLNILLDGSYVHGGCPNRMDPPSSYGTSETYDEVEVIKGFQTVQHGGGGSGGTVLFKRHTERLTDDTWYRGKASMGFRGNANATESFLDTAVGNHTGFIRLIGNHSQGDDYKDGAGVSVRSAYRESTGNLILGWTPSDDSRIEFSYEQTGARDLLYAGAGMDTPYTDHAATRFKFNHRFSGATLHRIHGQVSYSAVDHLMDNYSLRTPASAIMYMRAPSESDTWSGRFDLELVHGDFLSKLGIDYQDNKRTAIRYRGTASAVNNTQSYLWPDVTLRTTGLYGESEWTMADDKRLTFGLRYDYHQASADRTSATPNDTMGSVAQLSAADLYTLYYGGNRTASKENTIGGMVRLEQDVMEGAGTLHISLGRAVRSADASERYLASNNNTNQDNRWVGNPFLSPEKHHQVAVGAQLKKGRWDLDSSFYYNRVNDFILRDRDHSAHGAGNATIYRNVQATLYGGEVSLNQHWNRSWSNGINLAYVHATNTTDDRPIAQTPPLDIAITTDYRADNWNAGMKLRLVAEQNRVDDDTSTGSGLDAGQTAGFQTIDLYGGYQIKEGIKLKFGINNVLDRNYAEHLNQSNAFDTSQVQVNEPGRSFWVTAGFEF